MYNESLNSIEKECTEIQEKINKQNLSPDLKEILNDLSELILHTAKASLFANEQTNKKYGNPML
jgi:hypothetical protein